MTTTYPTSVDTFSAVTGTMADHPTHSTRHTNMQDAILAVQTALGTSPAGTFATVRQRLEAIEADDWVTSARIAPNAVGSSELADNAVDTAAIQDDAVTAAKVASGVVGSLLATEGVTVASGDADVIVKSTDAVSSDADARLTLDAGNGGEAEVLLGQEGVWVGALQGRADDGSVRLETYGSAVVDIQTGGSSSVLIDEAGDMSVYGDVTGAGHSLQAKANAVLVGSTRRDPIIYRSTSPLNVIVPTFAGQRCLVDPSNAANCGAREWVATGTTAGSWVVSDGDTGWYDVTSLANIALFGFATPGARVIMRRCNSTVEVRVLYATLVQGSGASANGVNLFTSNLPTGWQAVGYGGVMGGTGVALDDGNGYRSPWTVSLIYNVTLIAGTTGIRDASTRLRGAVAGSTTDPWPTAAPV